MKRILFILHYPPPLHGSSVVGQCIKESFNINQSFECRYINLTTSHTIDEIGKRPFGKIGRYFYILWQVLTQLILFKPNLCYLAITAKGIGFYKDSFIVFLVKLFRVKLVYHFHNKGVKINQDKWLDNLIYRMVFKKSEVVLLSKYLYPDIQKYVPETRVHYCPNGIPDIQIPNNKSQIPKSKVEILFLSNLIETKGVSVLLEACKILQNKQLNFHCTFIGGEGDINVHQLNKKVQELDLNNWVHYVGKKYGDEKHTEFSNADIFAFPTYYHNECFPLVLLEAMQSSLPVISTFEGAIPEVVEDGVTGFLVPQKDAETLANKLEFLILNPELRKKMGAAGRLKYEKEFTLDIFELRITTIIMEIIEKAKT